jgi:hypothetical protein
METSFLDACIISNFLEHFKMQLWQALGAKYNENDLVIKKHKADSINFEMLLSIINISKVP